MMTAIPTASGSRPTSPEARETRHPVAARFGPFDPLAGDAGLARRARGRGCGRARAGRHRGRGRAVGLVRDRVTWRGCGPPECDGHACFDGEVEPCINGQVGAADAYFGQDVRGIVDRTSWPK